LKWHDGAPVTAEDCVASLQRWGKRDGMGQKLMTFVDSLEAKDPKTFVMKLKSPTGLVLLGLGKPSSNVPFMMPKRVAETDPNTQISDFTGSGPFVFKRDEWKPGDKTVYVKFDKYVPRSEPASGFAGGRPGSPLDDMIETRLLTRLGYLAATICAIMPPIDAPTTWALSISKRSIRPTVSAAISARS